MYGSTQGYGRYRPAAGGGNGGGAAHSAPLSHYQLQQQQQQQHLQQHHPSSGRLLAGGPVMHRGSAPDAMYGGGYHEDDDMGLPADELVKSLQPVAGARDHLGSSRPRQPLPPTAGAMYPSDRRRLTRMPDDEWESNQFGFPAPPQPQSMPPSPSLMDYRAGMTGRSRPAPSVNSTYFPPEKYRRIEDMDDFDPRELPRSAREAYRLPVDFDADAASPVPERAIRQRQVAHPLAGFSHHRQLANRLAAMDLPSHRWDEPGSMHGRVVGPEVARRIHRELQPPSQSYMEDASPAGIRQSGFDSPGSRIVTPAAALHNAQRPALAGRRMAIDPSQSLVPMASAVSGRETDAIYDLHEEGYGQHTPLSDASSEVRCHPVGQQTAGAKSMRNRHAELPQPTPSRNWQQTEAVRTVPKIVESPRLPTDHQQGTPTLASAKKRVAEKTRARQPSDAASTPSSKISSSWPTEAVAEPKRRCGRKSMNYSSEQKRERNRAAVKKCRQRQALKHEYLKRKAEVLASENRALSDMLLKNVELDAAKRISLTRGIQMDILLKIKEIFTQSLPKDFVLDADSIWDLNSVLAVSMPSRCYYGIESIKDFWRTSLRMRNKGKIRSFWAWLFRLPPGDRFTEFAIEPFSPTSNLYFISWTTKSTPPLSGSIVIMFGHGHRVTLHVEVFGWLIWRYLLTNTPFPEPPFE